MYRISIYQGHLLDTFLTPEPISDKEAEEILLPRPPGSFIDISRVDIDLYDTMNTWGTLCEF